MTFELRARDIRKSFGGVEVLHGVDLDAVGGSVLALLGENGAGKSTLVKIIAGDYQADSGAIEVDGASYPVLTPRQARDLGVAIIFQEFQDASTLTVAENISLGRLPATRGLVSWKAMKDRARRILDQLQVDIDPDDIVGTLRVGERQIVEIARSLSGSARLLILDEPTAALSHHEAETLFQFIRRLRDQGVAIIYITHRLDEVTAVADRVQVLRDGSTSLLTDVAATDRRAMIEAMIGRRMAEVGRPAPATWAIGERPALAWRAASAGRAFADVSLEVRPGEVVGLFGKLGSGAAEVGETAFGIHPLSAGTLEVNGQPMTLKDPYSAIAAGTGFLPADRKAGGAFLVRPIAENVAVASWPRLSTMGFISERVEGKAFQRWRERLSIRSRNDPRQTMGTLSGGNQQKVLLARWLERDSRALVLIEPTRGVDVGAREDIYRSLRELAAGGAAVLVVTSDYEEAVQVADRVYVMSKGRVATELHGDAITTAQLLAAAGG
ncbi:MAG: sugar ABC transporter ATP-binding protein [Chloroflexi bacterium]|nr:sugar ABC transporter ATP-binding protein [Chloroflexota bacterium]